MIEAIEQRQIVWAVFDLPGYHLDDASRPSVRSGRGRTRLTIALLVSSGIKQAREAVRMTAWIFTHHKL